MEGYHQLGLDERIRIECLYGEGGSARKIAGKLGRHPSTISRELKRNCNANRTYQASSAQRRARQRIRGRPAKAIVPPCRERPHGSREWQFTWEKLQQGWSPEIIAARYRREHFGSTLCHETVYRFIYAASNRREQSWKYLAAQRPRRCPRSRRARQRSAGSPRPGIAQRPAAANERREPGHWEADLMCFRKPGAVLLHVVDRATRFGLAMKLAGKHAGDLMSRLIAAFSGLPAILRETVTFDNGSEFFAYQQLKEQLGMDSYFCDAYASWQKGTVENQNRALRRYLPRWTDLNGLAEDELVDIREELNDRPMKCLGWLTPREMLFSLTGLSVALHL
jgi:IS30 family transposase